MFHAPMGRFQLETGLVDVENVLTTKGLQKRNTMGRRWKNRYNNKLIITTINYSALKVMMSERPNTNGN